MTNLPNYPSAEVKEFGKRVSLAMLKAGIHEYLGIQNSMVGRGDCKQYDLTDFDEELRPYIEAYLEGNCDSAALMYAAMRTKELQQA